MKKNVFHRKVGKGTQKLRIVTVHIEGEETPTAYTSTYTRSLVPASLHKLVLRLNVTHINGKKVKEMEEKQFEVENIKTLKIQKVPAKKKKKITLGAAKAILTRAQTRLTSKTQKHAEANSTAEEKKKECDTAEKAFTHAKKIYDVHKERVKKANKHKKVAQKAVEKAEKHVKRLTPHKTKTSKAAKKKSQKKKHEKKAT